jgi:hypothetical protein
MVVAQNMRPAVRAPACGSFATLPTHKAARRSAKRGLEMYDLLMLALTLLMFLLMFAYLRACDRLR